WNSFRLVTGWTVVDEQQPVDNKVALAWFEARLHEALTALEDHYSKFRISDALMTVYKLIWYDFCWWYLKMINPEFGKAIGRETYQQTVVYFETVLKVLHPFMPFITEELWHALQDRGQSESIMVASW